MSNSSGFNAFKIKRQAHNLSRQNTNEPWNVFRHISWGRQQNANITSGDLEGGHGAGHGDNDTTDAARPEYVDATNKDNDGLAGSPTSDEKEFGPSQHPTGSNGEALDPSQTSNATTSTLGPEQGIRQRTSHAATGNHDANQNDGNGKEKKKKKKKDGKFLKNIQPKEPFTIKNQIQNTFLNSWINVLLLAVPIGIAFGATGKVPAVAIFVINFIAIIPLAAMLSYATEEIALRTGETLGGLLNATFGNAVELIVAVLALKDNEISIVQTSLIGSILSNLLLVMGMCFFFGGLRRQEQFFNETVAQTAASILALAIAGIVIPTVFDKQTNLPVSLTAALSRGTAVILLVVYAAYLYFQLKTHADVFNTESKKVPMRPRKHTAKNGAVKMGLMKNNDSKEKMSKAVNHKKEHSEDDDDDEEHEEPKLSFVVAIITLGASTVFVAVCAEYLVGAIDQVTQSGGFSKDFLGLILLPIVGNAAEHATALTVAVKDKMDLAIGVAVGSSMQVALFVIPLLVIIGWGMGIDAMNLSFDWFQVAVLFVSVLLVNYLIGDGKSHWLEGMLLMCLYLIIAVCSWYYPLDSAA